MAEDEAKTIALVPFVQDDDDPTGTRCDNTAELRIRRFTAIGAVEAGILNSCERCLVSGDCVSGVCLRTPFGGRCVPDCSRNDSSCETGLCQTWNSMEGVVRFGCGSAELVCDGLDACAPDALEPNDTVEGATPLGAGEPRAGTLCERDDDWFAVSAPGPIRITTTSDRPDVPVEGHLFAGDGHVISTGALTRPGERVLDACVPPGGAWLRTFAPTLERTGYRVVVERPTSDCDCVDDPSEPDGPSAPRSLATEAPGQICGANADYFAIEGRPGERTTIQLSGAGADLDMDLLAPDGSLVAASRGTGPEEWLVVDLREDQPHQLRVFAFDQGDATYELTIEREPLRACASSTECSADESCIDGLCARLLCTRNADCPVGSICPLVARSQEQRTCLESCREDGDCRDGDRCKQFFEGAACFAEGTGTTGTMCESTAECGGARTCVDWPDGHCAIAGCDRAGTCNDDGSCAVVDGRALCVETCWISNDECSREEGFQLSGALRPGQRARLRLLPGYALRNPSIAH